MRNRARRDVVGMRNSRGQRNGRARFAKKVHLVAAVAGVVGAGFHTARAITSTWSGGGADTNFSTIGNWNNGVPGTGDNAIFSASAATVKTTNIDSAITLNTMAFQQAAAKWTVSGSDITLTPAAPGATTLSEPQISGSSLTAITSNIILGANQAWLPTGATGANPNVSFGGAISLGANTLTLFPSTGSVNSLNTTFAGAFSGSGQLIRNPANGTFSLLASSPNWSGGGTFYGGTLVAGTDQALGTGTINISPALVTATGAPASLSFQSSANRTYANNFVLNDPPAGNWVLTNLGATTANPAVAYTFNGAITLAGGGTRVMTSQNATVATFNNAIGEAGGSAALQLATPGSASGLGTYNFNATNTYTGGTTMWAGTLNLNAPQSGNFTQGTGTASTLNLNATMTGGNYTSSAGTITLNSPQSSTTFTVNGATLAGKSASTFPGGVTAASGNISFATDSVGTAGNITSGPIGTGKLTVNMTLATNTLNISNGVPGISGTARTILNDISIGGTGNIQFGNTNVPEFFNVQSTPTVAAATVNIGIKNGSITTFAGGLVATNGISFGVLTDGSFATGAFILPTANNIQGDNGLTPITIHNGIVVLGDDASLGTSPLTFDGTTLAAPGSIAAPNGQTRNLSQDIYLRGSTAGFGGRGIVGNAVTGTYLGTINFNGNINLANTTAPFAVTLTADAAGSGASFVPAVANFNGPVTEFNGGQNAIVKAGNGTVNLFNSANSWSLGTTVTAGTLGIHTNSLPGNGATVATNGTLQFNQDFDGTYNGTITGSGNLSKIGSGTVTLTQNNTYVYTTSISAGTLSISSDSQLGVDGSAGAVWVQLNAAGSGFTTEPSIAISGAGAGAASTAYLGVNALAIATRGTGYTSAPTITFSAPQLPGGVAATGTVGFDATNKTITSITLTSPGSGYTSLPTALLSNGGATTQGTVTISGMAIQSLLTTPGTGYAGLPLPSIAITGGGGTGASLQDGLIGLLNLDGGTLQTNQPLNSARNVMLTNTTSAIDTMANNAVFSGRFFGTGSLTKLGSGELTLSGNSTTTGALSPSAGTLEVIGQLTVAKLTGNGSGALSIPGGTVTVSAHAAGAANDNAANLSGLSVTGAGKFDVANNDLIINYTDTSPASTIRGYLVSGFNQGNWDGNGIASATAHADASFLTALGYADVSNTTFDGQSIPGNAVIVKYTYYGDNNLDGKVDASDFQMFLDGFIAASGGSWAQGDYTYDGRVDLGNDFNLFLINYLRGGNSLGDLAAIVQSDSALSITQKAQLLSLVPEPGSITLLGAAGLLALRRRHRR
jgi:fibronectin-binding autotransporter adhesin